MAYARITVSTAYLRSIASCSVLLCAVACGPPERDDSGYEPWGGIDQDGDGGETSPTAGDAGSDGNGDAGGDASGDGPEDGGSSGDDGEPGDGSSGEPEPPGSPYSGGWDIGDCQDQIVPTGVGVGQVVPDFTLVDQFGDPVRLYDFCHEAVYIVAGAFW